MSSTVQQSGECKPEARDKGMFTKAEISRACFEDSSRCVRAQTEGRRACAVRMEESERCLVDRNEWWAFAPRIIFCSTECLRTFSSRLAFNAAKIQTQISD